MRDRGVLRGSEEDSEHESKRRGAPGEDGLRAVVGCALSGGASDTAGRCNWASLRHLREVVPNRAAG
jgi:hypothetical protein